MNSQMIFDQNSTENAGKHEMESVSIIHNRHEGKCSSEPSRKSELSICMCTSGNAEKHIMDKKYSLSKGSLWIEWADTPYWTESASEDFESCEFVLPKKMVNELSFTLKGAAADLALLSREPVCQCTPEHQQDYLNIASLAEGLLRNMELYKEKALGNLMISLVYLICDVAHRDAEQADNQVALYDNDRKYSYFVNFLDLLGQHSVQERSVKFYADKLFITPKYFSSIIKEVSGKTAGEWIEQFVMLEAKMMLQKSENNVSEIAYKLNFPSISFFGKYFKRNAGMSPSDFKRQYTAA